MKRIIVGGCGSSGTTLTARLLNSHPEVYCGPEISIFDRPSFFHLDPDRLAGIMKSEQYHELDASMPYGIFLGAGPGGVSQSYCGLASWRWEELFPNNSREAFIKSLENGGLPYDAVSEALSGEAEKVGKKIWAEKTPGNIFCHDEAQEAYGPDTKFIYLLRNPFDVTASLVFHRSFLLYNAVVRWIASANALLNIIINKQDNTLVIFYENLVDKPRDTLDTMQKFLGLSEEFPIVEEIKNPQTFEKYEHRLSEGSKKLIALTCQNSYMNLIDHYVKGIG